jgi:hypothetical protein
MPKSTAPITKIRVEFTLQKPLLGAMLEVDYIAGNGSEPN